MVTIVTREQWGAESPSSKTVNTPLSSRKAIMSHHTAGVAENGPAVIQAIQKQHKYGNKWADIGYNYLITPDGTIYEGRGRDAIGAHCLNYNTASIGIAFVGTYTNSLPSAAALASYVALADQIRRDAGNNLLTLGHRDKFATICPGDPIYDYIRGINLAPELPTPEARPEKGQLIRKGTPGPAFPLPTDDSRWCYGSMKYSSDYIVSGKYKRRDGVNTGGVRTIQEILVARGWDLAVDGIFGPATERAVTIFQKQHGLTPDGLVGAVTWYALFETDAYAD